jgi:hypothetical protein
MATPLKLPRLGAEDPELGIRVLKPAAPIVASPPPATSKKVAKTDKEVGRVALDRIYPGIPFKLTGEGRKTRKSRKTRKTRKHRK